MPIASFTENIAQNLPMWAHYSNNHRGYAVKYKVNNKRMLRAVLYQSEIEDFTNKFLYFLHSIFASKETHNLETIKAAHFYSSVFLFIPFTKHQSWKYEKEYRMIYPEIITESRLNVETSNLGIEPTSVYAGIKCSEEHKERLEATIDDGRWEVGQILDLMDDEVDLSDIRRRLENLKWELDY